LLGERARGREGQVGCSTAGHGVGRLGELVSLAVSLIAVRAGRSCETGVVLRRGGLVVQTVSFLRPVRLCRSISTGPPLDPPTSTYPPFAKRSLRNPPPPSSKTALTDPVR
jgi:hypothetical protein